MPNFSFGQSQGGGLFGATSTSQSFPPVNGSGATESNSTANASFPAFGGNTSFNFGASAPSTGFTFSSGASTPNPFSQTNGSTAATAPSFQPNSNLFSANTETNKPNPFAPSINATSGGFFGQSSESSAADNLKNKSTFVPTDDAMHTSPDRPGTKANQGAFSFLNTSQPPLSGNSLFSKPSFGASTAANPEKAVPQAPNFFGTIPNNQPPAPSLFKPATEAPVNIFSSAAQPKTPSLAETGSLGTENTDKKGGLFGSISRPASSLTSEKPQNPFASQPFGNIARSPAPAFGSANTGAQTSSESNSANKTSSTFGPFTPKPAESAETITPKPDATPALEDKKPNSVFAFGSSTPSAPLNGNLSNSTPFGTIASPSSTGTTENTKTSIGFSDNKLQTQASKVAETGALSSTLAPAAIGQNVTKEVALGMRSLNAGLLGHLIKQDKTADWSDICKFYLEEAKRILDARGSSAITAASSQKVTGTSVSNESISNNTSAALTNKANNASANPFDSLNVKRKASNDNLQAESSTGHDAKKARAEPSVFQSSSAPKTSETASIFKSIVDKTASTPSSSSATGLFEASAAPSKTSTSSTFGSDKANTGTASTSIVNPFSTIKAPNNSSSQPPPNKFGMNGAPQPPASSTLQPPKFNMPGTGTNFMGQFGSLAAKQSEKEKEKRKAEDFDSDEDDEAEWEKKDAEQQKAKKAQLEAEMASAKNMKAKIVNGEFVFEKANEQSDTSNAKAEAAQKGSLEVPKGGVFSRPASPANSAGGGASVFASPQLSGSSAINNDNIFGHLSDVESGAEGKSGNEDEDEVSEEDPDKRGNGTVRSTAIKDSSFGKKGLQQSQENESDDGETLEDALRRKPKPGGDAKETNDTSAPAATGGLFDRIKVGSDGKPQKSDSATPKPGESTISTNNKSFFGQGAFGQATSPFGSKSAEKSDDHTWKADSPIKFGNGNPSAKLGSGSAPAFSFTPATPAAQAEKGGTAASSAAKPFGSLFGNTSTGSFSFGAATPLQPVPSSKAPDVGFSFGSAKPAGSMLGQPAADPTIPSATTSRATTPGVTTDASDNAEQAADSDAPAPDPQQRDLTALSETELAEEEVLFDGAKGRAIKYERVTPDANRTWVNKGIGPVRLLKSKSGGIVRILMRAAPSGKIVINTRLMAKVAYTKPKAKTAQVPIPDEQGQMSTWIVRFGSDEDSDRFVEACEKNKA